MLLRNIILTEKIYVDSSTHDKLHSCFDKWLASIYPEFDGFDSRSVSAAVDHDYYRLTNKLRSSVLPTIRHALAPHFPSEDTLNKYYANKKARWNRIGITFKDIHDKGYNRGHKLSMTIDDNDYGLNGSVGNWVDNQQGTKDNTSKFYNSLQLAINKQDLVNCIVHQDSAHVYVDRWVATLTHELTHLIQSLKSAHQAIHGAPLSKRSSDLRELYLSDPHEIEAFAQTVASKVLSSAKRTSDPIENINRTLNYIKMGLRVLFNRELFAGPEYSEFKDIFNAPTKDLKLLRDRQFIWKKFQQALVSKLVKYLEQLSQRKV